MKIRTIIAAGAALVCASVTVASALTFEITDVVNKTENGFGSTLFHAATGSGGMSGAILDRATGEASGFWNDVTGDFNISLGLVGGGLAIGQGEVNFDGIGNGLVGKIEFDISGSQGGLDGTHTLLFRDAIYSAAAGVNGFDGSIIGLWGAAGGTFQSSGNGFDNADFGADFRISVTPIPLPPAIAGFLAALASFGWLARRQTKARTKHA